ncbi:Subtilisin protease SBT5.4 [Spatholobus suberectus]|nr:Subtilisin protease SBT5.4 [Spatholobus suberectus]
MGFSVFHLISLLILWSFLQQSSYAIKRSYIVYLGSHSHGPNPSASDLEFATNSHYKLLGSHLGSHEKAKEAIFYSYNKHINGFAAILEEEDALEIAKNPNVVSLFLNKGHELQTTRSWGFLGLESDGIVPKDSIWEKARYGEGVIIASIDTGVWPESKSFSDEGMTPVPSRWRGICQLDNFTCNSSIDAKAANATIEDAKLCKVGTLDPKKAKGKILVCLLKEFDGLLYAEEEALSTGTVGLILANNKQLGNDIMPFAHLLPTSHINYTDGEYVYSYIEGTKIPMAYMTRAKTLLGVKPAPVIASFSSRGPNPIQPTILKPDITAPGVDILCAGSEAVSPTGLASDNRRIPYNIGSGTSESCPHVSGIIGLLKRLYPNWSPAALKSAIMTTAMTLDNNNRPILDQSKEEATPFAYGVGHIQPELAMDPGLVYDLNTVDYLNFLCGHGYNLTQIRMFSRVPHICPKSYNMYDFNYPSITVPNLGKHSVEVTRTVTNVGSPGTYQVHVKAPIGVSVLVEPRSLTFNEVGEKKRFKVFLKGIEVSKAASGYVFGGLWWSDGKHKVKSPLVVKHN